MNTRVIVRCICAYAIVALCLACTSTKVIKPDVSMEKADTSVCENVAKMLDYTSDSNCGYLFELEDGTKLLPYSMPEVDIPFLHKQKVVLGYKKLDANITRTSSPCEAGNEVVEITCIRKYEDSSAPRTHDECKKVKNVFLNPWMAAETRELKPQKIFEYDYSVGFLYLFRVGGISYLYDCLGNKMCGTDDGGDCDSLIETLGEPRLLQVLKN